MQVIGHPLGGRPEVRLQLTGSGWLLVTGVLLSLCEHPAVIQGQAPPRLTTEDLAWPGLAAEADSTAVRRRALRSAEQCERVSWL
jgi:hypothetical protein